MGKHCPIKCNSYQMKGKTLLHLLHITILVYRTLWLLPDFWEIWTLLIAIIL